MRIDPKIESPHRKAAFMDTSRTEPPIRDDADDLSSVGRLVMSRRVFAGGAAAVAGLSLVSALSSSAASAAGVATGFRATDAPHGPASVSGAPRLPREFTDMFESRFVTANGIRQHVVIGGDGPPLLLVHGWPENWYAWRFLMPTLARDFTVIAPDQRGIGLSEKAADGYDSATLANDLVRLMDELGHDRFAVVGHDTGYIISYALAADHRDRVERLALAEIPGPPGVGRKEDQPVLFLPEFLNNRLWHIPFNRVNDELIVEMVRRSADEFYRYEYAIQGGGWMMPDYAIRYYIDLFSRDRDTLRATFGLYRAWDATVAQNQARETDKLTIPVLGIGGENSWGALAALAMTSAAVDVQTVVIAGTGHWVAEQSPDQMLAALTSFLAPYMTAA
jgi:pimeloyl-ACP methyl ester carboxylesterase